MSGHAGHDMSSMTVPEASAPKDAHGAHALPMKSALGPYSMAREGSGTSWQPEATPMPGLHFGADGWTLMAHGLANVIYDRQTGPRGGDEDLHQSMGMVMGNRPLGPGTLGLRAMVSLDPTMGASGYPLLFQTGETADGWSTSSIDSIRTTSSWSCRLLQRDLGSEGSAFAYAGLPGEPALGPSAFMHRFSGMRIPEAPLTHHWLDSTHITFGVATLGASQGTFQLEGSWFNGREPDQFRWNIETRKFDSWSARLSFNPTPELSMQVSYGDLKSPEQLEPDTRVKRTTASIIVPAQARSGRMGNDARLRQEPQVGPGRRTRRAGLAARVDVRASRRAYLLRPAEQVENSELFAHGDPLHGQAFRIRKFSVGYIHDFARTGPVKWGVGGLIGLLDAPSQLDPSYGSNPRSYMVFLQGRL